MKRQLYVCGFAYNGDDVLLIRKNRPDWQEGKLNGIGGHVDSESASDAMIREFHEEAGVLLDLDQLTLCVRLMVEEPKAIVTFFRLELTDKQCFKIKSMTDERVQWIHVFNLYNTPYSIIPNLRWLIPLCRDVDVDVALDRVIVIHTKRPSGT